MESVTPQQAIDVLNRALEADRKAISSLVELRVACNEALTDDPTIQVGRIAPHDPDDPYTVGVLGVINGIFGTREEDRFGHITAWVADDGRTIEKFMLTSEWKDNAHGN